MKEMDGLKWKVTFVDAWAMGDEREREGGRERERESKRIEQTLHSIKLFYAIGTI